MRQSRSNKGQKPDDPPRSHDDVYQSKDWADVSVAIEEGVSSGSGNKERRIMAQIGKKPQLSVRSSACQEPTLGYEFPRRKGYEKSTTDMIESSVETVQFHFHDFVLLDHVGDLGSVGQYLPGWLGQRWSCIAHLRLYIGTLWHTGSERVVGGIGIHVS